MEAEVCRTEILDLIKNKGKIIKYVLAPKKVDIQADKEGLKRK